MRVAFDKIIGIGSADIADFRLAKKVRFANILAISIMVFGVLFFVVNGVLRNEWTRGLLTLLLIPAGLSIIALNFFKFHRVARTLVGFLPLMVCVFIPPLVHVFSDNVTSKSDYDVLFPIIHSKMAAIASAVCPFVLLDLRKRINQIMVPLIAVTLVLLIDPLHLIVTPRVFENAGITREQGIYNNFVVLTGIAVVLICMYFIAKLNIRYEDRMLAMLSELNSKSNKLKAEIDLRRVSEMEMQAAKDQALSAVRSRTAFFAQMNHEIRTPLHGITALSSMLGEVTDPAEKQKMQESLQSSAAELMRLLNNVLDLNKIESEKFDLNEKPFDLVEMFEKIRRTYIKGIGSSFPVSEIEISSVRPLKVKGDDLRISQVIHNLVVNAFKHGKATKVIIGFELLNEGTESERVQFFVKDNGAGMEEQKFARMMEKGFELDGLGNGNYGLGLFISQKILSRMDSELVVTTGKGVGTRFSFTLKMAAA